MGGAGETGRVVTGQTLLELGDALGRVLEKNADDLAQKRVVIARGQGAKVFDGLGIDGEGSGHGKLGWTT